jgi:hypothetical protein
MRLLSRTERKNSASTKRCANAYSEAHPPRPLVPPHLAVRLLLVKAKVTQKAEVGEKAAAVEEITVKRERLRRLQANLDTSTIHLLVRPNQTKVAVLNPKEMGLTLWLRSNQYAVRVALMQVEEVASISTAVLEQAKTCTTETSFLRLRDNIHLLIPRSAPRCFQLKEGLVLR